jgi:dipeptide/tripeptide permease
VAFLAMGMGVSFFENTRRIHLYFFQTNYSLKSISEYLSSHAGLHTAGSFAVRRVHRLTTSITLLADFENDRRKNQINFNLSRNIFLVLTPVTFFRVLRVFIWYASSSYLSAPFCSDTYINMFFLLRILLYSTVSNQKWYQRKKWSRKFEQFYKWKLRV